jgi:hypothetical protein
VDTLRLQRARARRLVAAFRAEPRRTMQQTTDRFRAWGSRYLGLDEASRRGEDAAKRHANPAVAEIGD